MYSEGAAVRRDLTMTWRLTRTLTSTATWDVDTTVDLDVNPGRLLDGILAGAGFAFHVNGGVRRRTLPSRSTPRVDVEVKLDVSGTKARSTDLQQLLSGRAPSHSEPDMEHESGCSALSRWRAAGGLVLGDDDHRRVSVPASRAVSPVPAEPGEVSVPLVAPPDIPPAEPLAAPPLVSVPGDAPDEPGWVPVSPADPAGPDGPAVPLPPVIPSFVAPVPPVAPPGVPALPAVPPDVPPEGSLCSVGMGLGDWLLFLSWSLRHAPAAADTTNTERKIQRVI